MTTTPGERSDVVVVGAGPAGAVTALLLARQGRDVVLVDRAPFPRPKPCGDCLSAGATDILDRVGLRAEVEAAGPARLRGWDIVGPSGHTVTGRFADRTALAMERRRFDGILRDAAGRAGARLLTGRVADLLRDPATGRVVGVAGRGPGGEAMTMRARLVVGADGLRSVVAARLGRVRRAPRLRKVSLTTHIELDGPVDERGTMHLVRGGCVGLAPVGPGRYNLTIVAGADHAPTLRELGPEAFVRQWITRAPALRGRLDGFRAGAFLASGPFDRPVHPAWAPGAALVGDAAGYFDPFTGQGIHHAMAGAETLARLVAPALDRDDLDARLRAYGRAHRRLLGSAHRFQRLVERALAGPRRAEAVLRTLARSPAALDRVVAVAGDLAPPRVLLSPALLSTFLRPPAEEIR